MRACVEKRERACTREKTREGVCARERESRSAREPEGKSDSGQAQAQESARERERERARACACGGGGHRHALARECVLLRLDLDAVHWRHAGCCLDHPGCNAREHRHVCRRRAALPAKVRVVDGGCLLVHSKAEGGARERKEQPACARVSICARNESAWARTRILAPTLSPRPSTR